MVRGQTPPRVSAHPCARCPFVCGVPRQLQTAVSSSGRVPGGQGVWQRAARTTFQEPLCLGIPKSSGGFLPSSPALTRLSKQEGRLAVVREAGTGARQGQTLNYLSVWCESRF